MRFLLTMLGLVSGWWLLEKLLASRSKDRFSGEWPVLVRTREHPQPSLIRDWLENRGVTVLMEEEHMKGYFGTPAAEHCLRVSPEQYAVARKMLSGSPFARYLREDENGVGPPPAGSINPPRPAG